MKFSKSYKYFLLSFGLLFVLSLSVISVLLFFAFKEGALTDSEQLKIESRVVVDLQHDLLSHIIQSICSDVLTLSHSQELRAYAATGLLSNAFRDELITFSKTKKMYDQISYREIAGEERFRITLHNGHPEFATEQLSQGINEQFFPPEMTHAHDALYLSPFDLNVTDNRIEIPYKPVIRFFTTVRDTIGEVKGILCVTYLGKDLLDHLNTHTPMSGHLMLINSDGYFLKGLDPKEEWAFMFAAKQDRTIKKIHPKAWEKLNASQSGQFYYDDGLMTFTTIYPSQLPVAAADSSDRRSSPFSQKSSQSYYWKLVSHVPATNLHSVSRAIRDNMPTIFLFLCILPLLLAGSIALVLTKKMSGLLYITESETKYRNLVTNIPAMVYKANSDWELDLAYGLEELTHYTIEEFREQNKKWTDLLYDQDCEQFFETVESSFMQSQNNFSHSYRIHTKEGHIKWVEDHKSPMFNKSGGFTGYEGVIFDTTDKIYAENEKELLSDRLRQAQKMEAVGVMAGGIAHDFNNILAGILGYASMALDDLPPDNRTRSDLEQIIKAANRAKDVVEQILIFSRKHDKKLHPVQIHHLIKEAIKLIRASIPSSIEIHQNISQKTSPVLADPSQIHQILMNLCANAAQAMNNKGILEISLLDIEMLPGNDEGLNPGTYVHLSISDNGPGIRSDILEKIFDPFFTTKEVGKGTGMGLSVVYGIVERYKGTITVESEAHVKTTFHVYLPATSVQSAQQETASLQLLPGTEKILIVDDEEMIVKINKKILEKYGYCVTTKTNPVEALETFRANPDHFDLLITDQTMPHLSGVELASKITAIKEGIPIILCSGYTDDTDQELIANSGIRYTLKKPFRPHELIEHIQKILAAKGN